MPGSAPCAGPAAAGAHEPGGSAVPSRASLSGEREPPAKGSFQSPGWTNAAASEPCSWRRAGKPSKRLMESPTVQPAPRRGARIRPPSTSSGPTLHSTKAGAQMPGSCPSGTQQGTGAGTGSPRVVAQHPQRCPWGALTGGGGPPGQAPHTSTPLSSLPGAAPPA